MGHLIPDLRVGEDLEKGVSNLLGVGGVDQQAMVQRGHDVHGPPVLSRYRGDPVRSRLPGVISQGIMISGVTMPGFPYFSTR